MLENCLLFDLLLAFNTNLSNHDTVFCSDTLFASKHVTGQNLITISEDMFISIWYELGQLDFSILSKQPTGS